MQVVSMIGAQRKRSISHLVFVKLRYLILSPRLREHLQAQALNELVHLPIAFVATYSPIEVTGSS